MEVTIPDTLTRFRLLFAPTMVFAALAARPTLVAVLLIVLQVTDWIDGPLARRFGSPSAAGARLDSLADATMFGSLTGALVILEGHMLVGEWPWLGAAIGSYGASMLYALARFGGVPAYHQWSAKVSGPVTLLAALAVLLAGVAGPIRLAAVMVTLGNLEAILITRKLSAPATDVPSVFLLRD